jgi:hypothetical protein
MTNKGPVMSDLLARARNYLDSNDDPAIAGDLIVDFIGEVERLRAALTEIAELAMRNSKLVQDYYKKYPDPVDADIGHCDH